MIKKAVLAGGCFWCLVKPFENFDGIIDIKTGYTGGTTTNPTYKDVCSGIGGHYEAVEITFDDTFIKYEDILDIFFKQINPTDDGGQFVDRGPQYRPAIFFEDNSQKETAEKFIAKLESENIFEDSIVVSVLPLSEFYPAEENHQNYHKKQSAHYNIYYKNSGRYNFVKAFWDGSNPKRKHLKNILSDIQFEVTQNDMTECPFDNEYYNNEKAGIYVDIVGGEVLFSSTDKFDSGCGWPSFSKPVNKNSILERSDFSMGMIRTEVRSLKSNSHLGHVFDDGPEELGGLRYCINSASLRFIPVEDMEKEGYGEYLYLFNK